MMSDLNIIKQPKILASIPDLPNLGSEIVLSDSLVRNTLLRYIEEFKKTNSSQESKFIFSIICFQIYQHSSKPEEGFITEIEVKDLETILNSENEIELQLKYLNWLFLKAVYHRSKTLNPGNNTEFKTLNAAYVQAIGKNVFEEIKSLNEEFAQNMLNLERLNRAFQLIVHFIPNKWGLFPTDLNAIMAEINLKNPNMGNED